MQASVLLFIVLFFSQLSWAETSFIDEAQTAAAEGRFDDVISILSSAIDSEALEDEERAIALSNRGIAFSLLKRFGPAMQDLRMAIELQPDHLLTLNHLGILAEHVALDFEEAALWYEKAAALGYAASQVNLGNLYRDGHGVPKDSVQAVRLYQRAMALDYDVALVALGQMLMDGEGIEQDVGEGVILLQRGVEQGVLTGHYYLGIAHEKGKGVPLNYQIAINHYRTAAVQGHGPSQGALGYMIRRGYGVRKDFIEAVKWYRLAAEQGDIIATNRLAWLLATCPVRRVCDGHAALEFAKLAVDSNRSATNLDSMAAAFARIGEFDKALTLVEEILADKNLRKAAQIKYSQRIYRYQNGIAFQL